jgi:hypothetical protein
MRQGISLIVAKRRKTSSLGPNQIARHLFHPLPIGIDANSHDLDRAGLELDHEKHHVADRTEEPQCFHAEEIEGVQRVPVHLHEPLPRPLAFPLWRRLDSRLLQDVRHRFRFVRSLIADAIMAMRN